MIRVASEPWREMVAHARSTYPNECCGAMLGRVDGATKEVLAAMKPEAVSPAVLAMVHEGAPNRVILNAGANGFERTYVSLTKGVHIPLGPDTAEQVVARFDEISDRKNDLLPQTAGGQGGQELAKAGINRTTRG